MGKKTSEKTDDNLSEFKVGDRVKINMQRGRIVEAEVRAVVEKTHGVRLQVSFGEETALIYLWQEVEKRSVLDKKKKAGDLTSRPAVLLLLFPLIHRVTIGLAEPFNAQVECDHGPNNQHHGLLFSVKP